MTTLFCCCNNKTKGFPELLVDNNEYNFGSINQKDTLTHLFSLKNNGSDLLKIIKISGSCNCLEPEITKKELLPDETASLKIRVMPKANYRGAFDEKVIIETNTKKIFETLSLKGFYDSTKTNTSKP